MAKSRNFHWVVVNRDHTPEIPERFHVSAYPSMLILGENDANVHRFQSFQEAPEFLANLEEGLERLKLHREGKDWDTPRPRAERLTEAVPVTTMASPSDRVPAGLVRLGDTLWVGFFGGKLRGLDPATGAEQRALDPPTSLVDYCSDGEFLYGVPSGWTAGQPIQVLDPVSGQPVRHILTEENQSRAHGAKGLAWRDGSLWVLEGMAGRIREVDPESGRILSTLPTELTWVSGLAFDGEHFLTVGKEAVYLVDPEKGSTVREVPVHYPLRSVGVSGDRILVMEQPVFGFGRQHERIQVWPQETVIHCLDLSTDDSSSGR